MSRWRHWCVVGVLTTAMGVAVLGCESDEFDDAPTTTASGEDDGSGPPAESMPEDDYGESPGPVRGSERPPDHPTLSGGFGDSAAGGQQGASMDVEPPEVERVEPDDYGEEGPILWQAPSQWQPRTPANDMRFAQYEVDSSNGQAELVVFYFGPGGGGGVDSNLDRWASQFEGERHPTTRQQRDVGGMTVHTLDASGTYHADMAMAGGGDPVDEQRLLGAIAETSKGLFFFRLLGDQEVVNEQVEAFDSFVDSFEEGS